MYLYLGTLNVSYHILTLLFNIYFFWHIRSPYSVVRGSLPLPASLSEAETEAKGLFLPEVTV